MLLIRRGVLILVGLVLLGCTSNQLQGRNSKLPSGRTVRIMGIVPMHFSSGPPALMLQYQTDLKIADKTELRKEVDDIWTVFRLDAEKGNFSSAIISANEGSSGGFVKHSNSYNFVFEKRTDGTWKCLDDAKSESKQPV